MSAQNRRENAAAHDFVDESLFEERRPRFKIRALLLTLLLLRIYFTHQDRLIDSRRFIDGKAVGNPKA